MERKIVKIGGSYYIALPTKWVRQLNLSENDRVYLNVESDGRIIVTARPEVRESKYYVKNIDLAEREIVSAYLAGYDLIEVRGVGRLPLDLKKKIENLTRKLAGLEIVEDTVDRIVLQCFKTYNVHLTGLVRRMEIIVKSMVSDSLACLVSGDREVAEDIKRRDEIVDRIYMLIVRTLRKALRNYELLSAIMGRGITLVELLDLRIYVRVLEEIADNAERIANLIKSGVKLLENEIRTLNTVKRRISGVFDSVIEAFREHDIVKVERCLESIKALREKISVFNRRTQLYEALANILDLLADICDLTFKL